MIATSMIAPSSPRSALLLAFVLCLSTFDRRAQLLTFTSARCSQGSSITQTSLVWATTRRSNRARSDQSCSPSPLSLRPRPSPLAPRPSISPLTLAPHPCPSPSPLPSYHHAHPRPRSRPSLSPLTLAPHPHPHPHARSGQSCSPGCRRSKAGKAPRSLRAGQPPRP